MHWASSRFHQKEGQIVRDGLINIFKNLQIYPNIMQYHILKYYINIWSSIYTTIEPELYDRSPIDGPWYLEDFKQWCE